MTNFAGPDLVKRVVAAEVFHVWAKRRGGDNAPCAAGSDGGETANDKTDPPPPAATTTAAVATTVASASTTVAPAATTIASAATIESPAAATIASAPRTVAPAAATIAPAATTLTSVATTIASASTERVGDIKSSAGGQLPWAENASLKLAGHRDPNEKPAEGGGAAAAALTSRAAGNGDITTAGLTTGTPPSPAMRVEVGLSPAPTPAKAAPEEAAGGVRSPLVKINDADVINLAGPASSPGGPRVELKMTVGELRKARLARSAEFKQLLMAMLNDPIVQAGELDVVTQSNCPTPQLTEHNSSGAAAAAAAARSHAAAARALEDTTRAMALLASGRERDRAGHGGGGFAEGPAPVPNASSNTQEAQSGELTNGGGGGGGSMDLRLGVVPPREQRPERRFLTADLSEHGPAGCAERPAEPPLHRLKRARPDADLGGGGGGKQPRGVGGEGQGAAMVGMGVEQHGGGVGEMAASSKRRRQLWMLAIRENELRHERRKEEARKEYETRQQELLRWMIDEEAGRHNALDGDAGPPPMVEKDGGGGSHSL